MRSLLNSYYLQAFSCGLIGAFSQAPYNILPLLCLSYSLLLILFHKHHSSSKQAFLLGHGFGFGYFLGGLYWIGNALLVDTAQFGLFLPFAYLGLPFALGLFYALPLWCASFIKSKNILFLWGVLAICLSLSDVLRGYIFTGFPWNLPLYATAFSDMAMQPAFLLGTYFYNFIIVTLSLGFGVLFLLRSYGQKIVVLSGIATSLCLIFGYGFYRLNYVQLTPLSSTIFRIVQPNIPQTLKWSEDEKQNHFETLLSLSQNNLIQDKNYVFVWPETALPFHPEIDFSAYSRLKDATDNKHEIITGKMRFVPKPNQEGEYFFYNAIFKTDKEGISSPVYDKIHLVPFGEYLPLRPVLSAIGFSQINFFKSGFSAGKDSIPFTVAENIKVGSLICYEAIFPQYARKFAEAGADIIVNVTNDAWFGTSAGPYQHLVQTRFRAVETGKTILRSANTGISAAIDPLGRVMASLPLNTQNVIDVKIIGIKQYNQ